MILFFAVVGIFTDKWHNPDYLKSIEASNEILEDRPAIDYSIITVALLGFVSEIIHIFVQIGSSFFCSKKKNNLTKIEPEPKVGKTIDVDVKIEQDSIEPMSKDQGMLEKNDSQPNRTRSHKGESLVGNQNLDGMAQADPKPLEESVIFNLEES